MGVRRSFRFTTRRERAATAVAALAAMVQGAMWPVWAQLFGRAINEFDSLASLTAGIRAIAGYFVVMGVVSGAAAFVKTACMARVAAALGERIRVLYFRALLRQEVGFCGGRCAGVARCEAGRLTLAALFGALFSLRRSRGTTSRRPARW